MVVDVVYNDYSGGDDSNYKLFKYLAIAPSSHFVVGDNDELMMMMVMRKMAIINCPNDLASAPHLFQIIILLLIAIRMMMMVLKW